MSKNKGSGGGRLKSRNQMQQDVKAGRVPKSIKRIDKELGTKDFPQDEEHFTDGDAIYIEMVHGDIMSLITN